MTSICDPLLNVNSSFLLASYSQTAITISGGRIFSFEFERNTIAAAPAAADKFVFIFEVRFSFLKAVFSFVVIVAGDLDDDSTSVSVLNPSLSLSMVLFDEELLEFLSLIVDRLFLSKFISFLPETLLVIHKIGLKRNLTLKLASESKVFASNRFCSDDFNFLACKIVWRSTKRKTCNGSICIAYKPENSFYFDIHEQENKSTCKSLTRYCAYAFLLFLEYYA